MKRNGLIQNSFWFPLKYHQIYKREKGKLCNQLEKREED